MATDYISRDIAISELMPIYKSASFRNRNVFSTARKCLEVIENIPTVDAVPIVRCKECKHRIVNKHYGEKGYIKLTAFCELDTGDIFSLGRDAEDENWFCANGERKKEDENG